MTNDEIEKLTPKELRLAIARAVGYTAEKYDNLFWYIGVPENKTVAVGSLFSTESGAWKNAAAYIPDWPADIAAA